MIVIAGITGNLGSQIAQSLLTNEAKVPVRALLRRRPNSPSSAESSSSSSSSSSSPASQLSALQNLGLETVEVDYGNEAELVAACTGASCVVSALSGLRDVIVGVQTQLLQAAVKAGVPRFIPSDYSVDFTLFLGGNNRNLDFRREFYEVVDKTPGIAPTSIFCGMFMDLLTGKAPFILPKIKRVGYWGESDVKFDFTTVQDAAAYTARAALDNSTPRKLLISGDNITARELATVVTEVTGQPYSLLRFGSLSTLEFLIPIAKMFDFSGTELYPPWQGMQYMNTMSRGVKMETLDNTRYPEIKFTTVKEMLAANLK